MVTIIDRFSRLSYKNKLMLSYLVLILLPTIGIGLVIYNHLYNSFIEKSDTMIEQRLNQELKNINSELLTIENLGYQLTSSNSLNVYLNQSYEFVDYYRINNKISPIFYWCKSSNLNINSINIFTYNRNIPEIEVFTYADRFDNEDWFITAKKNTTLGMPYWENLHLKRDYRNMYQKTLSYDVYSLFYIIASPSESNISYLELEISPKALFQSLVSTVVGKNGFISVLDSNGSIISNNSSPVLTALTNEKDFTSKLKTSKGSYSYDFNKNSYNISYKKIERLNSYIVCVIPSKETTDTFAKTRRDFLTLILSTLAALTIIAWYFDNLLTKKINKLMYAIKQVSAGNFDILIDTSSNDELDKLSISFNKMSSKINELINKVYKSEIAEKEAQLFALQSQIKPHFIYNTLESLKMMAELKDEEEISDCLTSLGNLMRRNNHIGNNTISIETEIEYLKDYVKIQNLLNNNKIKLNISAEDTTVNYSMLNMIIQPFIENSIQYAMTLDDPLIISLSITNNLDYLTFVVEDNGKGIPSEKLLLIKKRLSQYDANSSNPANGKGIGIHNVNKRIKLYYGVDYGVDIDSLEDKGTKVTINIPIAKN